MTVREAKPFALVGCALGFALGSWNLIAFWLNPLDDSVAGMLVVYGPMFISRESGFESFRAFTNCEYLKDAPLKIAVPTAIGAVLPSIGGLAGMLGQRSTLTPEMPS